MTISSTNRQAGPYSGNDITVAFPFAFKVFSSADLLVKDLVTATGIESTLSIVTHYTAALNSDQNANPGGTITLVSALASGHTLTITSDLEPLQSVDLTNQGGFYPRVINDALDKLTILCQQAIFADSKTLQLPSGSVASTAFPIPGAGKFLRWNLSGDAIEAIDGTGTAPGDFVQSGTGAVARSVQSKLGEAISLKDFGAAGDGATNDAPAIQAAIDSGARIITGSNITYKVSAMLSLRSDLVLRDMTLDFSALTALDGSYRTCLKAAGSGPVASAALASNAIEGDYSVTVSSGQGSTFAAGDYVMLTSEDAYNYPAATVKRGEIKQVQSVATDTITFRTAIYEGYTTANTATLRKLSLLHDITLDNVRIIGTNTENHQNVGLWANYVRRLQVRHCSFTDIDVYCTALFNTIDFSIDDNDYDGVRYTGSGVAFYGVALFNCCQWGQVTGNRGQELRHLVVTSSSAIYYGQPYHVVVSHNVMRNAMAGTAQASWAYECHGFGRWIIWANNLADSCHCGINIEKGDQVVVGNIFRNIRQAGVNFDTDGRELKNILVSNNQISKTTGESVSLAIFGIAFQQHASQVRENILISNNIIEGFGAASKADIGIRIYPGSGESKCCAISGNQIINNGSYESTDYGIYIQQGGWIIRGNTIRNYERSMSLVAGADGCVVQANSFDVDTVSSTQAIIAVGSDNNIIQGNSFKNVYRSISNSGNGNLIANNTELGVSIAVSNTGSGAIWYDNTVPRRVNAIIASGIVTLNSAISTAGVLQVDTESAAATDDLDTITAGYDGQIIILKAANDTRDVVVKDGTGNLRLSSSFTMTHTDDRIILICDGTNWYEIGRSDNAA